MAVISEVNLSELKSGFRIDSEFYKPDYILLENELKSFNCKKIKHFAKVTDGEHGSVIPREFGIKYLTAENVKNGYIDISKVRYVDEKVDKRNKRASVRVGDILISIKGTLGEVAVAETWLLPANMNRDVAIIKPYENADIQSEYLTIFLMSKFGAFQAKREGSGGVQQMITLERLREFLIPKISIKDQIIVKEFYSESLNQKSLAESSYTQAINLLEEELGMDKLQLEHHNTFMASFSEVINNNRSDADYYQIKYRKLEKHLDSLNTLHLGSICTILKGYEVGSSAYTNSGPLFIRVSNFTKDGFTLGNSDKYISNLTYSSSKQFQPKNGDILMTKDGTIGTSYVVDEEIQGIISSGILNLHLFDNHIPKEYLALAINSRICQMQAQRDCSGALILHWKPEEIRNLKIPILNVKKMEYLADLVYKSKDARRESKRLLDQAKTEVETLIENAAGIAS